MSNAKCYFRIDTQTVCGHTYRHGSHDRWRRGDRKDGDVQVPYSHPFTPPPRQLEPVAGHLEVGANGRGEVVVNHPRIETDENGVGHIVFSPNQARILAALLIKHSVTADEELARIGAFLDSQELPDCVGCEIEAEGAYGYGRHTCGKPGAFA